ncbi:MAG: glycosyltransferase [bacterium]|nr:glycosyltransferase [bacterium]
MSHPFVSIIIPCFNEEKRLKKTRPILAAYLQQFPHQFEIVFVDDGSTDGTKILLETYKQDYVLPIRIISYSHNLGK